MESNGVAMARQVIAGTVPLALLFAWAEQFGRKRFDPGDTETLYVVLLVRLLQEQGADLGTVQRELAELIQYTGEGL
jgi:hypothetical protein